MKKILSLILALAMAMSLAACGGGSDKPAETSAPAPAESSAPAETSAPVDDTVYTLKLSSSQVAGTWLAVMFDEYAADMKEATNGRIDIQVYHDNSLGAPADLWTMFTQGGLEILNLGIAQAGEFPITDIVQTPFFVESPSQAAAVMYDLLEADMLPEFSDNMKVLAFLPTDMQMFATVDDKIESFDDFNGLKMRANSGQLIAAIEALNATAVSITTTEVFMALSQGTIDGGISSPAAMNAFKWQDAVNYLYDLPICTGMNYIGVNLDTWNSIPADLQAIMEEVTAEFQAEYLVENDAKWQESIDIMVADGVEYVHLDDATVQAIKDATATMMDDLSAALTEKGFDGAALVAKAQEAAAAYEG